jgi:hypothetical protein
MTKDEALKLALEALHGFIPYLPLNDETQCGRYDEALTAIKEALAQPEQEPVAFASHGVVNWIADKQFQHEALLYSAPQRTWAGLTPDELNAIFDGMKTWNSFQITDVYFAIEAKLKEKNS